MTRNVVRIPTNAGWATYCERAPEHAAHDQPLLMGVYACGVYSANFSAVLGCM